MKEQIEEMANDIEKSHWKIVQDFMGCHINSEEMAEHLYNECYRKQKEGEWIWKSNGYMNALHCSLCNKTAELHHNFCPNCGAQMKGGADNGKQNN